METTSLSDIYEKAATLDTPDLLIEYENWGIEEAKILHEWSSEYDLTYTIRCKQICQDALLGADDELREYMLDIYRMLAYTLFLSEEYNQPDDQIRKAYNTARDQILNKTGEQQ